MYTKFLSLVLVAVLFLFVVMMLNVTEQKITRPKSKNFVKNISVGSIIGAIIFLELLVVIGGWQYKGTFTPLSNTDLSISNTHALGSVLYTKYIHLTFSKRENIKRQSYFTQIKREKESGVALVDVKTGEGVKIDD